MMIKSNLHTPVQYLKGVGPKLAKLLKKLSVETIADLIYYFPRGYEDRSQIKPIAGLRPSEFEVIKGEVTSVNHQLTRNRFSVLKLVVSDRSGSIQAVFFNQPYLAKQFRKGMQLIISGKVEFSGYEGTLQLNVRDFEADTGQNPKIVPIYPLTEGVYPKKLRSIIHTALENHLEEITDWMPDGVRRKYGLAELKRSIADLHYPDKLSLVEPAHRRLAFDEFFVFQLGLTLRKKRSKAEPGIVFRIDEQRLFDLKEILPFKLTSAQERVLGDILRDLEKPHPMNRLVQGDVGSGKTVVAALAALMVINDGYQVAIMAPTEILAQQHYEKLVKMLRPFDIDISLMTGSTKKRSANASLYIGTHALIQDKAVYKNLGLVIIDEQHRFGVLQRAALVKKGVRPDVLVMSATPIPRSMALMLYGELDRSVIDEMPPGRTPVETHYVPEGKRRGAYEFMRQKVKEGRQVFVVCPLVDESEKVDLKAAMDEAERLQNDVFPELKVGLLHGRLKAHEKDRIMQEFRAGNINILVSTTVIEVGIDIPNATLMVIEHAERFGLSQLHQLRGRIGRGTEQSYCFLIAETKTPEARARIKAMLDSNDGFKIAEEDLRLRGPGDFCGTRQSGLPNFRVADIINDEKTLQEARTAADGFVAEDVNSARNIWESQGQKAQGASSGAALN
jgi:ATP-dependent DNA helicase RecG